MSEADLILALNEVLQGAGKGLKTRFCWVRYSPSGEVSALLTEKANAGSLIPQLSNVLIWATKAVDAIIIEWKYQNTGNALKCMGCRSRAILVRKI